MKVLVILGAAVWKGGNASPSLERRCNAAIHIWQNEDIDLIVPTGGLGRHPPAEASVMSQLLQKAGVPSDKILIEDQARNTFESAKYVNALLHLYDPVELIGTTDLYHTFRTKLAFWAFDRSITMRSSNSHPPRLRNKLRPRQWLREGLAIVYYIFRCLRQRLFGKS